MTTIKNKEKYIESVGRRKTSIARVRMTQSNKQSILINDRTIDDAFPIKELQKNILEPVLKADITQKFDISVHVYGGGITSQSEAIRLGIARGLVLFDHKTRGELKKSGFLKRDPRIKERRKFGLKKARKAPQWSKR